MTHLFLWPNQFSDVFISSIDDSHIVYTVRDKVTGILMEPPRKTKYMVDEINKMIHLDNRSMPIEQFVHAYNTLNPAA